jgi:hypothetical protein
VIAVPASVRKTDSGSARAARTAPAAGDDVDGYGKAAGRALAGVGLPTLFRDVCGEEDAVIGSDLVLEPTRDPTPGIAT